MPEIVKDIERIPLQGLVVDGDLGNVQIENCRDHVQPSHYGDGEFRWGVDAGVDAGNVEGIHYRHGNLGRDHEAAHDCAENDRRHGQPLHPAVGQHQFARRQILGQDAVLGGGIGGGTEADDGVGVKRMQAEQHGNAAGELDAVADKHHPAFG